MWRLAFKWAVYSHSNKSRAWVIARYFGMFNRSRRDRWVFGDRKSGAYLLKFAWTKIVRHQLVRSGASPDDPALADYWAERRRKAPTPPIDKISLRLLRKQDGRCALCGAWLLPADQSPREWEQWLAATRKTITKEQIVARKDPSDEAEPRVVHAHCHRRHFAAVATGPATSVRP
jgi:RNA-directed DNA polymerase